MTTQRTALKNLLAALRTADDAVGFTSSLVRPCRPGERPDSRNGIHYEAAAIERPLWEAVRAALAEYDRVSQKEVQP